jgi:glutathione S-transferase
MALKIYGVPISQPVRAVVWQLLVKRAPFTLEMAVPGMSGKIGTKGDAFRAKFPLGTVPALEDGDVHLSESVAIMSYCADKFSWHDLYPTDLAARARVHEYMAWSHRNTREASAKVFGPHVRADMRPSGPGWLEEGLKTVDATCQMIDGYWLQRTPFLAGQAPTIADFSCYEELAQLGPEVTVASNSLHILHTLPTACTHCT